MIFCYNESRGTSKKDQLALVVFHEFCQGKCWKLVAIFNLHKIKTRIDIFVAKKCLVTFGFKYIF